MDLLKNLSDYVQHADWLNNIVLLILGMLSIYAVQGISKFQLRWFSWRGPRRLKQMKASLELVETCRQDKQEYLIRIGLSMLRACYFFGIATVIFLVFITARTATHRPDSFTQFSLFLIAASIYVMGLAFILESLAIHNSIRNFTKYKGGMEKRIARLETKLAAKKTVLPTNQPNP